MNIYDDDKWRIPSFGKTAVETDLANIKKITPITPETEAMSLYLLKVIWENPGITTEEIEGPVFDEARRVGKLVTLHVRVCLQALLQYSLIKRQWFRR